MKKLIIILCFILVSNSYAKTIVSGTITDSRGTPVPFANVYIENTYDGVSSDDTGRFEFETAEKGEAVLVCSAIGYSVSNTKIELTGETIFLRINLVELINELESVTITAGSFTAADAARKTIFKALDIATTAGATADIAGALNTLPGTQKVGESGRLFVRGGDGNETKTFIDGMVVLDAYRPSGPNTPSRGRFLPFMFKGMSFSTGGYSAEYGQALSSALVLDSRDEGELTRTDIGLLSVGGDIGHTQIWGRGSIGAKIQYTNLRPYVNLIRQEIDWKNAPVSFESNIAFRQRVGKRGLIKLYSNINTAEFSLYEHDIDDYSNAVLYLTKNDYRYVNTFYKGELNENWTLRAGASYTFSDNKTGIQSLTGSTREEGLHMKVVVEGSASERIEVKAGAEVIDRDYRNEVDQDDLHLASFREMITAPFMETDVHVSENLVMRVGLRSEYNTLTNQFSVDPRISTAYRTGKNAQLSLAYGTFKQTAKNELVARSSGLDPEAASHYILNYQYVKEGRTLRIETYHKRYSNLVKYVDGDPSRLNNEGNGSAAGVELFWRDTRSVRQLDYWISYSFLYTKRDYLNFPYQAVPTFASPHNFSIVTKYFIRQIKTQAGVTYSFTSGRRYNNPNEAKFNGSTTPHYSDLSINLSYLPTPSVIIHCSLTNVLGRDNIFGYEYSQQLGPNGRYNGRAIRQAAPRFLFVGVLITLSKEKSVNQLPTL